MAPIPDVDMLINLDRVRVLDRTPDTVLVSYAGETVEVSASHETAFEPQVSGAAQLRLALTQQVTLGGVCVDERVPQEYLEVMIFHELREREYAEAGFVDAHARAVNDELLYVMKFLGSETVRPYQSFAKSYREGLFEQLSARNEEAPVRFVQQFTDGPEGGAGTVLLCVEHISRARADLGRLIMEATPFRWIAAAQMSPFEMSSSEEQLYRDALRESVLGSAVSRNELAHWSHLWVVNPIVQNQRYRAALLFLEDENSIGLSYPDFVTMVDMRNLSNRTVCDYVQWYDRHRGLSASQKRA